VTQNYASALEGIRVLDLTEARALYAGKLLADLGADVIKIEPPQGSEARKIGPFKGDLSSPETSLYFANFNTNKRGVTLDICSPRGKGIFVRMISTADVLLDDFEVGHMQKIGLDYQDLAALNPRLVMVSATGFGQSGPYSGYKAPDLISFAMGGLMFLSGAAAEPPVVAPCEQAYHASGLIAAFSAITALFFRLSTGRGQFIDIATHDMMSSFSQGIMRYSINSEIGGRTGSQFWAAPGRVYPCKDGYVHFLVIYPHHWVSFLELVGNPEVLSDKAWFEGGFRVRNMDLIDPFVIEFSKVRTRDEITSLCQAKGIPCSAVNTPSDVAHDPHMLGREFTAELGHAAMGIYQYLAPPYQLSETPGAIRRPVPLLGEHNVEIFCQELGIPLDEIADLKDREII
jgi:crotonobetainyl-CoA:carnitine CoA-transferase CaiB-like acyl-CoA transferase